MVIGENCMRMLCGGEPQDGAAAGCPRFGRISLRILRMVRKAP